MPTETLQTALNKQMNNEFMASHLYVSMAAWCASKSYPGFSALFQEQSLEERRHGMEFFHFLDKMGVSIVVTNIVLPTGNYNSLSAVCSGALSHEKSVTAGINDLLNIAMGEKNHVVTHFVQPFLNIQLNEEADFRQLVAALELFGDNATEVHRYDRELRAKYAKR